MNKPPTISLRYLLQMLAETTAFHPPSTASIPLDWPDEAWARFLQLARYHRVAPLLAYRAQRGQLPDWPPDVMRQLQKALHTSRLRHVEGSRALAEISAALTREGVAFIPLKGPSLADAAYTDTGLRPFDDLDVLIEPEHVTRAHAILSSLGYRPLPGSLPAWFVRRYHFHTQWLHPITRQCIELHWHPADKRNAPTAPDIISYVRELHDDPAAMAIYIAIHIAKHGHTNTFWLTHQIDPLLVLHPWSDIRLLWLLDFQGLCAMRKLDPAMLSHTAQRGRAQSALAFVQKLIEVPTPQKPPHPAALPRFSPKAALLRRMLQDLDQCAVPPHPWCLRANPITGIRPIRILDVFERRPR